MKSSIFYAFSRSIASDFYFFLKNLLLQLKNYQGQYELIMEEKIQEWRCNYLKRLLAAI